MKQPKRQLHQGLHPNVRVQACHCIELMHDLGICCCEETVCLQQIWQLASPFTTRSVVERLTHSGGNDSASFALLQTASRANVPAVLIL